MNNEFIKKKNEEERELERKIRQLNLSLDNMDCMEPIRMEQEHLEKLQGTSAELKREKEIRENKEKERNEESNDNNSSNTNNGNDVSNKNNGNSKNHISWSNNC